MTSPLTQFLEKSANRPYRDLIQYHINRQTSFDLQKAVLEEAQKLPTEWQPGVPAFVDETNFHFSQDPSSGQNTTCRQAFEKIITIAQETLPLKNQIPDITAALSPSHQDSSFHLFQIATLSFAHTISTRDEKNDFLGKRKGICK